MSLLNIFNIAGSALSAQSVRLNVTASNLANADDVASTAQAAYKARHPYFAPALQQALSDPKASGSGVQVLGVVESQTPVSKHYQPEHPAADAAGYVYGSNVNPIDELVNMISASRAYQNNVEVLNTSKELLLRTLTLGQ
jgi:flagellar basal-body rod protein FlgC